MHPEIKKFWETAGYEIKVHVLQGEMFGQDIQMSNDLWYAHKEEEKICVADSHKNNERRTYYYYERNVYFEAGMLRLIRLKALL